MKTLNEQSGELDPHGFLHRLGDIKEVQDRLF